MDVLNYDNAVSAFNNLGAFQAEKQQQLQDLVEQYKQGAEQVFLPALDLFRRGREAYNKVTNAGEDVASKAEGGVESAVEGATSAAEGAVEGAVEGVQSAVSGAVEGVQSALSSTLGEFSSGIRSIGNQLSKRMQTNAFERDPESEISSGEDNMGVFDRIQSVFRGGVQEGESLGTVAKSAVSEGAEAATSAAEGVASSVAEGIGSFVADAIPVVGELSMLGLGIYDFVKSETIKTPVVQAMATPILEKGV
jgi:phage-related protein